MPDSDSDGLPDRGEYVVGTSPSSPDTDGDGISDGAEVQQGTDPLDGLPARTGILSTGDTPGTALNVAARNDLAVVADQDRGVSVFNVAAGATPVLIAQVDTPGMAQSVAFEGSLVAVADGPGGLAIVDISDPPAAAIAGRIEAATLGGDARVVVVAGSTAYVGVATGHVVLVDLPTATIVDRVSGFGSVHDLALAGDELYVLTATDLRVFSIAGGSLTQLGALAVAGATPPLETGRKLFAGGGLVWVGYFTGYTVVDVRTPSAPRIIGSPPRTQLAMHDIAANGSGLILGATSFSGPGTFAVSLYDGRDPTDVTRFLTSFETPGDSRALSIYNGQAYVADGMAGLQVLNYLAYDASGLAPSISLSSNFVLASASGTAEEGKLMRLTAAVTDDVQVRNVDFYVDGVRVARDGNFPFEHRFVTPLLSERPSFTMRACASDTGGNSACTGEIPVTLTPDATAPRVVGVSPSDQSIRADLSSIAVTFSEPMDVATLTSAMSLTGAGPDGRLATADDVPVAGGVVEYREDEFRAVLAFPAQLAEGSYRAAVSTSPTDLLGNRLAEAKTWTFSVIDVPRLVPDVPVTTTIGALGEKDLYAFAIGESTRVVLQATGTGTDPCLRILVDIRGAPVAGGTTCGGGTARLDLVLAAGSYFAEVSDNFNNQTGSYTLLYQLILPASATPLTPDVPVTETITPLGDLDLFTFTLATQERVVLQATGTGTDPCLRVLTSASTPPVTGGTTCGGGTARLDLVLAAGSYFVEVSDNFNNQTGSYTLLYQPILAASATPLTPDVPVTETITPLGDLDLFTFTLATQERVVLQATGTGTDPCLRVLTSASTPPVTGGTTCGGGTARLDLVLAAGSYFVEVSDNFNNQTGSYTLLYQPILAASATPLTPDVPVTETITPLGDLDLFTFTLATQERVVLQATGTGTDPCLRVLTGASTPPVTGGTTCGGGTARLDLVLAAGSYFVEVSDNFNNQTGSYTLLYQPILAASATPLTPDVPVTETITRLGDLDLFTFTLATQERVVLQATGTGTDPCLRVLTGASTPPVTGGTTCGGGTARLDLVLAAGNYFVEVSDAFNNQTGSYTLLYQPILAASATPLTPDVPVTETITRLGDLDLFTFTLATQERVVLQATGTGTDPCLRVLTGASTPPVTGGTTCGGGTARLDLVLAAGNYFVEVSDAFNNHTGSYTLLYQPILAASATPLTPDVPVTETITPLGDLDLFTFTLATQERVVLQATGTGTDPCLRVLTGASTPPVTGGTTCGGNTSRLDLVLAAGSYFVEVSDNFNNHTGSYTLLLQKPVP